MSELIIGGEMEFDLSILNRQPINDSSWNGVLYSSGRDALYAILKALKEKNIDNILLPDYLCSSIVSTVKSSKFKYRYYRLTDDLLPDHKDIEQKVNKDAVLVINYFGMQDLSVSINCIKKIAPESVVIEDDVQAFYNFIGSKNLADYSFTSIRKWFAVPDGGIGRSRHNDLLEPKGRNCFGEIKLSGQVLKGLREILGNIDETYLKLLKEGEDMIDSSISSTCSEITKEVMERTDVNRLALVRKRNAELMIDGLSKLGLSPIILPASRSVPFFIPLLLEKRNYVRQKLFEQKIFCPVHWPLDGLELERGRYMAEHELSIIIDHRYGVLEINQILEVLSTAI